MFMRPHWTCTRACMRVTGIAAPLPLPPDSALPAGFSPPLAAPLQLLHLVLAYFRRLSLSSAFAEHAEVRIQGLHCMSLMRFRAALQEHAACPFCPKVVEVRGKRGYHGAPLQALFAMIPRFLTIGVCRGPHALAEHLVPQPYGSWLLSRSWTFSGALLYGFCFSWSERRLLVDCRGPWFLTTTTSLGTRLLRLPQSTSR